jgi:hypothetical protein
LIKLRQYITSGGEPKSAIKLLSEGFRGKPSMINLLRGWLHYVDQPLTGMEGLSRLNVFLLTFS